MNKHSNYEGGEKKSTERYVPDKNIYDKCDN